MTDDSSNYLADSQSSGGEIFSLQLPDLFLALRRRWWVVLATLALGGAGFFAASSRQPKIYTATARVVIDPVLPKVLEEGFDTNVAASTAETVFYNTQYEIMR